MSETDIEHNMGKAKNEKSQLTDDELVLQYREGNVAGFKKLLERYQAKVYGYIFSVVKDNEIADEIFEHVFYKVIITINRDQYEFENKFYNWVTRMTHRLVKSYFQYYKIVNPSSSCWTTKSKCLEE